MNQNQDCASLMPQNRAIPDWRDGRLGLTLGGREFTLYRQADIMALRDETEEDPKELAASKFDLNYIALDGEID